MIHGGMKIGDRNTTKTRIVAHSQQMVRIDHEKPGAMTAEAEAMLLKSIQLILPTVRGCVISDYGKGVITPSFTAKLLALTSAANLPTVTQPERAMVTKWFARLNGTGKLEIKGVDVEPFRTLHVGQIVDAGTTIAWAMVPKEGKRTFVVTEIAARAGKRSAARVYMTFDAQDALVGISY